MKTCGWLARLAVVAAPAAGCGGRKAGGSESIPALRKAVAALHGQGAAIVDGSTARQIDAGPLWVVTVPGVAFASELAAGVDGCVRERADLAPLGAWLDPPARAKPAP